MRIKTAQLPPGTLGDAIKFFLTESMKGSPKGSPPWPESAKRLAVGSFISGAQWGAGHPNPKAVLKQCERGQELFNKMDQP